MPPDHPLDAEVAREVARWLRYAREDAQAARSLLDSPSAPPRLAAWLAQQAAEKALKAILVAEQQLFPFTHNLARLRTLVPDGWRVREVEADWAALTRHAVEARYPDDLPDVSAGEAEDAVADAQLVVAAVEADLLPLLGA